jgi:hypothetical protein
VKRYLTLKSAAVALAAALLIGIGAAGAMVLDSGGSSAPPAANASGATTAPDFDGAFSGDQPASPQPAQGRQMTSRGQVNRDVIETAASKLFGITPKDVRAALQQGKSLAQLAADHGISRDALKTAIQDGEKTYLDRSVQAGLVTQVYADQTLQAVTARLDALIDQAATARRPAQ